MTTVQFMVPGINCGHCVATIERAVKEVAGVAEVKGNAATKQVTVTFEPPATRENIAAAMTEWDYPPAKE